MRKKAERQTIEKARSLPKLSQTVARSQYGHKTEGDEAGGHMEAVTTSSWKWGVTKEPEAKGTCMSDIVRAHCRTYWSGVGLKAERLAWGSRLMVTGT